MVKYIFFLFFFAFTGLKVWSQKKPIDNNAFDNWADVQNGALSSNGKYMVYTINKIPMDNQTLVIQDVDNKWKKEIIGATDAHFTQDSKKIFYKSTGDSLCLQQLGTGHCEYYSQVQCYKLIILQKKEWLVIQKIGASKELQFRELGNNGIKKFSHVMDFALSKTGETLLIQTETQSNGQISNQIELVSLVNMYSRVIWESGSYLGTPLRIERLLFDASGEQAIFTISDQSTEQSNQSIWHYKPGMKQAVQKMIFPIAAVSGRMKIIGMEFNKAGSHIFLRLLKLNDPKVEGLGALVDIWSYTDNKLQAQQLLEAATPSIYSGVLNLDNNRFNLLQVQGERLFENHFGSDNFMLLTTNPCYENESEWRSACRGPFYLVNARDGSRKLIKDGLVRTNVNALSPDGQYAIYYDWERKAYFSYKINTGKTVNISHQIPFTVYNETEGRAGLPMPRSNLQNWLPGNRGLIIYDEFDLWQIDPAGENSPICITKGYGRKNGIVLRLAKDEELLLNDNILLTAFRPSDKSKGFCQLHLINRSSPELLSMGAYSYRTPVKATNANTWLVQRMTASNSPNYFTTKNFRTFQQVSNVQPEKEYNWLTADLYEWLTFEGRKLQGILYKPENFDPHKKYPVIFNFYEEKSDELHQYLIPEVTACTINIPYFVSNGYLVFVPDIFYTNGEPVKSIYNSVVSAAKYIAKMPFVDSTKLGLQGHSWGGYEVNVLITNTQMFAAAAEAAGASDLVSGYGSVLKGGNSNQHKYETGQYRIKSTLWQKPELYTKNSPIFYADRVTTPMLILHCKKDEAVPFEQGIEWFTALRRLDKKAWMLQYDNGDHQIGGNEAEDYTIRLMQFFDHYLKGKPAPRWMTQGRPASLKGIDDRFELDPNGSCGKDCKVCQKKK